MSLNWNSAINKTFTSNLNMNIPHIWLNATTFKFSCINKFTNRNYSFKKKKRNIKPKRKKPFNSSSPYLPLSIKEPSTTLTPTLMFKLWSKKSRKWSEKKSKNGKNNSTKAKTLKNNIKTKSQKFKSKTENSKAKITSSNNKWITSVNNYKD